jgi:hypothetical protein
MKPAQLDLQAAEPEPTDAQLRDAHRHCRITRPFEECKRVPWLWPLIRMCARDRARRAIRRQR